MYPSLSPSPLLTKVLAPRPWMKTGLQPSSELRDSPHLNGLFHFSPASLSRSSGSAARARGSAPSVIPSPRGFGLLGEGMKLRKATGPGQLLLTPVANTMKISDPGMRGP